MANYKYKVLNKNNDIIEATFGTRGAAKDFIDAEEPVEGMYQIILEKVEKKKDRKSLKIKKA
jgi:hypothetical protein